MKKRIVVFGGSNVDDDTQRSAYELGALLAKNGYSIQNGGTHCGVMLAVARGAREANGFAKGFLLPWNESPQFPYPYNLLELSTGGYLDRLKMLFACAHGGVILGWKNSAGTAAEIFTAYQLVHFGIPNPFVVIDTSGEYLEAVKYFLPEPLLQAIPIVGPP